MDTQWRLCVPFVSVAFIKLRALEGLAAAKCVAFFSCGKNVEAEKRIFTSLLTWIDQRFLPLLRRSEAVRKSIPVAERIQ